jgi:hypothetical protein
MDGDGVCLTLVLVHVGVDKLNNIGTKRRRHDGGESDLSGFIARERENANEGTGSHGESVVVTLRDNCVETDAAIGCLLFHRC